MCLFLYCVFLAQCVAWYGASALASVPAHLSLAEMGEFPAAPDAVLQVRKGNTILVHCQSPKSNPPAVLQYFKDGKNLPGESISLNFYFNCTLMQSLDGVCNKTSTFLYRISASIILNWDSSTTKCVRKRRRGIYMLCQQLHHWEHNSFTTKNFPPSLSGYRASTTKVSISP